jgi:thiol-disulfide isomerase/thioredoxin
VSISEYRGKSVIMNFWTKTCPPCLDEMPQLEALAKALAHRPQVEFITICTDETAEDAKNTLQSVLGVMPTFLVLMDPESKVVADQFGTQLFPETWFIDDEGVIRARVDGQRQWQTALTIELAESLLSPNKCPIKFLDGKPSGERAAMCGFGASG